MPELGTPIPAPPPEFVEAARALGVEFEPGEPERLAHFLLLLLEATKTTNLTGITDPAEAWTRHILDAMSLVPIIASTIGDTPSQIIDIGSGGGLPAIPLAIVLPKHRVTLVDATGKKVAFLRSAAATLKLSNVTVLQARAEALGQNRGEKSPDGRVHAHREQYDIATVRALGHLAAIAELCGPLVRRGGFVLAVKGAKAEQELAESAKALAVIGLRHAETIPTPTGRIVVLEKTILTPRDYPRRDGEPARAPIGVA